MRAKDLYIVLVGIGIFLGMGTITGMTFELIRWVVR